ncbi:MAG: zonular occludens toxin domain-containing protein [Paludibacter sp.]|nr:zonular occludens toxin domain-containing protein [Paludibacter sp.]
MFHLITGTPGSGKTLSIVDQLSKVKDRPIFYFGIPELKLPWQQVKDPKNYHLDLPDGSIFVLDECQQHFPVRAPKDAVPPALAFIETHRHHGIDIYFITQHPNLLDHHARRLVGQHTHLQRNFGFKFAIKYTNNKLFEIDNYHELQACEKTKYSYPTNVYDLYKSAEIHTVKARYPKKLLLLIPLVLIVVLCIGYMVHFLSTKKNDAMTAALPASESVKNSVFTEGSVIPENIKKIDWKTAYIPEIQGAPYTAPLYRDLAKPVVMPVVNMCWSSPAECHCYTQQSSRVDMPDELCRAMVKSRTFNAFRHASNEQNKSGDDRRYMRVESKL